MSSKFSKLLSKWTCFGGKALSPEDEADNRLRMNQPKIIITECRSDATSPTFSRQSSSSASLESSQSDEEVEIFLNTDGKEHKMGMEILIRMKSFDEKDGGGDKAVSLTRVTKVEVGSFAQGFGIREGDIISKVNGEQCGRDIFDIKKAFTMRNSSKLEMEILRNDKNRETGNAQLLKMTICNTRSCTEDSPEETLEIIKISGSSWSLSDAGTYFRQGQRNSLLQFESDSTPWIVKENNTLGLGKNLSEEEVMTDAMFCIHDYWIQGTDSGIPVVIQHIASGLCVSLVGNRIELVEENDLDLVTNQSIIFILRVPPESGPQVTFQSASNSTEYIGFQTQGREGYGTALPFSGNEERNIVFVKTDM